MRDRIAAPDIEHQQRYANEEKAERGGGRHAGRGRRAEGSGRFAEEQMVDIQVPAVKVFAER